MEAHQACQAQTTHMTLCMAPGCSWIQVVRAWSIRPRRVAADEMPTLMMLLCSVSQLSGVMAFSSLPNTFCLRSSSVLSSVWHMPSCPPTCCALTPTEHCLKASCTPATLGSYTERLCWHATGHACTGLPMVSAFGRCRLPQQLTNRSSGYSSSSAALNAASPASPSGIATGVGAAGAAGTPGSTPP